MFSALDLDGDRRMTWEEFETFFRYHGEQPSASLFYDDDADGDGVVVWAEFSGPKGDGDVKARNYFAEMDVG